jgi:hypothetical protein
MALAEGQVQLRTLVMGPGSSYRLRSHFNPFVRAVRAEQGGPRAWRAGSWSGIELAAEAVIPIRLVTLGTDAAEFLAAHRAIAAAFAPSSEDLELRFALAGAEYVILGRPRLVEPEPRKVADHCYYQAAFVALDPLVYSAAEHSAVVALPSVSGGLTVPVTAPISIVSTITGGAKAIVNAGTAPAGLRLRVDGPVTEPRITLSSGSDVTTLNLALTLTSGQWLDIDTRARTVYLNGTASRRGQAWGGWPVLPEDGVAADIQFNAAVYDASAQLTVYWRDAWH